MQPYAAQAISPPANRSTRALQRKVRERVREVRNNKWSALWKELLPTELIGKWPKLLNRTATSPYPPLRTPTTLSRSKIGKKLSVSPAALKTMLTPPHDPLHISDRGRSSSESLPRSERRSGQSR
ncbi:hypothetical protein EVAR_62494_1 [Eumeta japonica]|uniref:Uncharacterized protein n=1 Tax=Eumeta variegata TaxID=151549 RepID=A0A4C1SDL0_EUMVA|nr:hypothetical protein EVAR_62494_1 [Eumeta japonica]